MKSMLPITVLTIAILILMFGCIFIGFPDLEDAPQRISAWSVLVSLISALAAIAAGLAAYQSYESSTEQDRLKRETIRIEEKFDTQIAYLNESKKIVAALVNETDIKSDRAQIAVSRFWELYYSDLIGVEGPGVENAMIDVGDYLRNSEVQVGETGLENLSLRLSNAVRVEVKVLEEKKTKAIDNIKPN